MRLEQSICEVIEKDSAKRKKQLKDRLVDEVTNSYLKEISWEIGRVVNRNKGNIHNKARAVAEELRDLVRKQVEKNMQQNG